MKALDLIMKNDGLGDQIGCCPNCEQEFVIPLKIAFSKNKPSSYPCKYCGQLVKI